MNIVNLIKDLKIKEGVKKLETKAYNEANYKLILALTFKYKDTNFDSSTVNGDVKKQLDKEFVAGGYVAKDSTEPTKLAQAKIVDYLAVATKSFENLVQHSEDDTQEFIILINAQAKKMGFVQTQQELDEIDEKRTA